MKILKRLLRLIYLPFIIIGILAIPLEAALLSIRWVLTGRSFPSCPLIIMMNSGDFVWSEYWNDEI